MSEVRRCDELDRKLRFIEQEVRKDNVRIPDVSDLPKAPQPREIIDLEVSLTNRLELMWCICLVSSKGSFREN